MTNLSFKIVTPKHEDTKITKDSRGNWSGETYTEHNGQTYKISTFKTYRGLIHSSSQPCDIGQDGGVMFSNMFNQDGTNLDLVSSKVRATEKAIREQHAKALLIFDEKIKEVAPAKKEAPEVGTILFLDGYGKTKGSRENKHVIYDIINGNYGTEFKTVELDTLKLSTQDHVRPWSEKFGIGTYFEPSYKFEGSQDELTNLVIEARQKAKEEESKREAEQILRNAERAAKIEEGKKLVNIPANAKAVIVAENMIDDSDSQTDYFNSYAGETLYLAYSTHTRDLFGEMRKAALNCNIEEVRAMAEAPKVNINRETAEQYLEKMREYYDSDKETLKHWHPEDEHREKYSMGAGYYLKASRGRAGWRIKKESYYDLTKEDNKNKLYIAAAEGLYFIPIDDQKPTQTATNTEGLELIDYSSKAFAIIGDTKPHKDQLKELGGRFNFRLKCGAGWIFSKTKLDEVKQAFNID